MQALCCLAEVQLPSLPPCGKISLPPFTYLFQYSWCRTVSDFQFTLKLVITWFMAWLPHRLKSKIKSWHVFILIIVRGSWHASIPKFRSLFKKNLPHFASGRLLMIFKFPPFLLLYGVKSPWQETPRDSLFCYLLVVCPWVNYLILGGFSFFIYKTESLWGPKKNVYQSMSLNIKHLK